MHNNKYYLLSMVISIQTFTCHIEHDIFVSKQDPFSFKIAPTSFFSVLPSDVQGMLKHYLPSLPDHEVETELVKDNREDLAFLTIWPWKMSEDSTTSLFLSATSKGAINTAIFLLSQGADPNGLVSVSGMGMTALGIAALTNNILFARVLLKAGARVDGDCSLVAPLHLAAMKNHVIMGFLLIKAGARVHLEGNVFMFQPIGFAAESGSLEMMKLLLRAGAKLEGPDLSKCWEIAYKKGHDPVMSWLIEKEVNADR